mgnify:CR=1 FL=1
MQSPRTRLILCAVVLHAVQLLPARNHTVFGAATIEVPADKTCEIRTFVSVFGTDRIVAIKKSADGTERELTLLMAHPPSGRLTPSTGSSGGIASAFPNVVVAGPVTLKVLSLDQAVTTYHLRDNNATSSQLLPHGMVVVPTDAKGDVDVILESSTDLVNWTAAVPGKYGAATQRRFFRLRAIQTE